MLYKYLSSWNKYREKCTNLNITLKRVNRTNWQYDKKKLALGYYTDAHSLRPYKKNKHQIDRFMCDLGLKPPKIPPTHVSTIKKITAQKNVRKKSFFKRKLFTSYIKRENE